MNLAQICRVSRYIDIIREKTFLYIKYCILNKNFNRCKVLYVKYLISDGVKRQQFCEIYRCNSRF